ncbi:MAG: ATP-binding protein [Desulfobacula sp.]|uniref:AAA family ATPase n=1 Tax=Desulfobacula sp. TaxID=2593537 RepID=UPI0025BE7E74|nr:ATP-binding protein [Desulfobacula sp.]MCD4720522.1 ATP-binding protein [Desulfobacula sp.]
MLLNGFGFSGYRSVGNEFVKINPLKKINLIIGQNNSGKSNIISFLKDQLGHICNGISHGSGGLNFQNTDYHISNNQIKTKVGFPIPFQDQLSDEYINRLSIVKQAGRRFPNELILKILSSEEFSDASGTIWFIYEQNANNKLFNLLFDIKRCLPILTNSEWSSIWSSLTAHTGGGLETHWIPNTLSRLAMATIPKEFPKIEFIPAIRKVGDAETKENDFSGVGIIERIAKLQNPSINEQELKNKFDKINKFVRKVLENNDATIEIPYERNMIIIHMDSKTLPLTSLGTGIHEVIILATAATLMDNSILCVEEPELHLHPLLQKRLLDYLANNTTNQYFFTTHSAHLINTNGAEVFHVKHNRSTTRVEAITTTKDKSLLCQDLGYQASDLLQANSIIWVEGPSDRIYINKWIKALDGNIVEGVHYSIMFYGGRLFSHLTADDPELNDGIQDFISLRRLNRNTCIVFDSDKSSSKKHLNLTKKRLRKEFNRGPGFTWVTKGREIENYINADHIETCVKKVHPSAHLIIEKSQWSNL